MYCEPVTAQLGQPTAGRRDAAAGVARPWAGLALAAGSGFAGLGYEIVWTQQLGIALGHEIVAVLAVLAAFFAGLGVGGLTLARAIERSTRAGVWYAACEAAIASWALVLSACMPAVSSWLAMRIGPQPDALWHWTIAFLGPFALLLPATCAMGAVLPALERASGSSIPGLYAANTFGAVLGVLAAAFLLVPWLGLTNTTRVCAAANGLCALIALTSLRAASSRRRAEPIAPSRAGDARLLLVLAATGVLGIGYEVLIVRVLSQITQCTVYTFAILLAVYLLGTALGGAIHQRWLVGRDDTHGRDRLLAVTAGACLLGVFGASVCNSVEPIASASSFAMLGGVGSALAGETAVALAALLPATMAMGVLFSQLSVEARRAELGWGVALAANTFGAALAPVLFGVVLLPALGAKRALLAVVLGYLLLIRPATWLRAARDARAVAALACGVLLCWSAPPSSMVDVPPGGRILQYLDGVAASVSVIEDADGVATLHINNRQQEGSSATLLADARQAWLPLLLHARPRNALFLGLGTGLSAGSAAWDPQLNVHAVELLPEVVSASAHFAPVLGAGRRAARVVVADARRYVRSAGPAYDVIVADLFHPARSGAAALYTVEHFAAVRTRLAHDGLFCQWLPLHQLDLDTLRSIVSSFVRVYPGALALLATNGLDTPVVGLVARANGRGFPASAVRARLARVAHDAQLNDLHLEDELAVLGSFIAGPQALRRFAANAALNTDDRPIVAQRAPFATYAAHEHASPRARLLDLLSELEVQPDDVLAAGAPDDAALRVRLAGYFAARDRFIALGARVRPNSDVRAMLEQVGAPLLAIVRASPDFRPAYDPLLNMAASLPPDAAAEAHGLLLQLAEAQPARPEASRLLQRLSNSGTADRRRVP